MTKPLLLLAMLLPALPPAAEAAVPPLPLAVRAEIPLPGGTTRFDYQSEDSATGRLFISHMGDGTLLVFDTRSNQVLKELTGFPADTGVTAVASVGRVYVSVAGGGEVAVVDAKSLEILARIPAGKFPDGSAYVPALGRLYVSDELGAEEVVIDTQVNKRLRAIPLGGEAGMTAYDSVSGHIFVNVQSNRSLDEIDPKTDEIVAAIPLPSSCDHNHGLLLDEAARLAFIACDGNARLLVLDLGSRKALSVQEVGEEPDVMALDTKRGLLYVAGERGVLSLFKIEGQGLKKLGEGFVGENAHTVSVEPETGLVYIPVRDVSGHPVLKVMAYTPPATH